MVNAKYKDLDTNDEWLLMIHQAGIEKKLGIAWEIVNQLRDRAKKRIFPAEDLMIIYLKKSQWSI
jgi:hypothetical protein